jgi:hypothetical protein
VSHFALVKNATLTFRRTLTEKIDPDTGNLIPDTEEIYVSDAFFKRSRPATKDTGGVPIGSYPITHSYTVGRLPAWCEQPINPRIKCEVDFLGSGYFYHTGYIDVVFDEVSILGETTPLSGYFTMQGSQSSAGYI